MPRTSTPITKLPSGRWQVRYRDNNGQQRKRTFPTSRDAHAFHAATQTALNTGTYVAANAGRSLFRDFAAEWGAAQDWAPSTRASFGPHVRRLEVHLGDLRLDQIDSLRLQRTRAALAEKYATSTATITMHYATAIMRAAFQSARIPRDVTVGVKPPARRGRDADHGVSADKVPTRDEVVAIIAAAPAPFRAAIALGACGLRVGEVLGVTLDRVDLEGGGLVVDRQLQMIDGRLQFKRPKRERTRSIVLPSWARMELRRHRRDHGPFWSLREVSDEEHAGESPSWSLRAEPGEGELLFRGGRGSALRRDAFYEVAWRPALVGAGLAADAYVFHSLRHWCASALLAEGAPITAVAGHLGDVVETVSRTYSHWLRDDREVPALLLDRMLSRDSTDATAQP
jgi:integrase